RAALGRRGTEPLLKRMAALARQRERVACCNAQELEFARIQHGMTPDSTVHRAERTTRPMPPDRRLNLLTIRKQCRRRQHATGNSRVRQRGWGAPFIDGTSAVRFSASRCLWSGII